jgi:hypothetical protein
MKIHSAGLAVILLSLVAFDTGNALTPFSGVINPKNNRVVVDTAIVNVLNLTDTFLTTGWSASGTTWDTFQFPDLSVWPSRVTLIGTVMGLPNLSAFPSPQPDSWYNFQSGTPNPPVVQFISPPAGLEESRPAFGPLQCLNVSPSVVTGQMLVRLQPAAPGKPVVQIHDAVGNVVRTLECTVTSTGLATATWNREDGLGHIVPEGVYFCRYAASSVVAVRKVLVTH